MRNINKVSRIYKLKLIKNGGIADFYKDDDPSLSREYSREEQLADIQKNLEQAKDARLPRIEVEKWTEAMTALPPQQYFQLMMETAKESESEPWVTEETKKENFEFIDSLQNITKKTRGRLKEEFKDKLLVELIGRIQGLEEDWGREIIPRNEDGSIKKPSRLEKEPKSEPKPEPKLEPKPESKKKKQRKETPKQLKKDENKEKIEFIDSLIASAEEKEKLKKILLNKSLPEIIKIIEVNEEKLGRKLIPKPKKEEKPKAKSIEEELSEAIKPIKTEKKEKRIERQEMPREFLEYDYLGEDFSELQKKYLAIKGPELTDEERRIIAEYDVRIEVYAIKSLIDSLLFIPDSKKEKLKEIYGDRPIGDLVQELKYLEKRLEKNIIPPHPLTFGIGGRHYRGGDDIGLGGPSRMPYNFNQLISDYLYHKFDNYLPWYISLYIDNKFISDMMRYNTGDDYHVLTPERILINVDDFDKELENIYKTLGKDKVWKDKILRPNELIDFYLREKFKEIGLPRSVLIKLTGTRMRPMLYVRMYNSDNYRLISENRKEKVKIKQKNLENFAKDTTKRKMFTTLPSFSPEEKSNISAPKMKMMGKE